LSSPIADVEKKIAALPLLISPLEGEMAGRPEGVLGAVLLIHFISPTH